MRVTVCELPHEPAALEAAWGGLGTHTRAEASELVLLPELAFVEPFWAGERFDADAWARAEEATAAWLPRLPELGARFVVGTRPVRDGGKHYNEGFLWERGRGMAPLPRKHHLPDQPGGYEARWFAAGPGELAAQHAGDLGFALRICSELWALEGYAACVGLDVQAILAPRATGLATVDKWLAVGTVAAVRSGCYCLSSNRVQPDGACGGVGWIIDPDGVLLARTAAEEPWCTRAIDPAVSRHARTTYPRSLFAAAAAERGRSQETK